MLALMIIGSYLVFLSFGSASGSMEEHFNEILGALSGIAGAVVGFYFGSKGAEPRNGRPGTTTPDTGSSERQQGNEDGVAN